MKFELHMGRSDCSFLLVEHWGLRSFVLIKTDLTVGVCPLGAFKFANLLFFLFIFIEMRNMCKSQACASKLSIQSVRWLHPWERDNRAMEPWGKPNDAMMQPNQGNPKCIRAMASAEQLFSGVLNGFETWGEEENAARHWNDDLYYPLRQPGNQHGGAGTCGYSWMFEAWMRCQPSAWQDGEELVHDKDGLTLLLLDGSGRILLSVHSSHRCVAASRLENQGRDQCASNGIDPPKT
jgi:hypothetical protein